MISTNGNYSSWYWPVRQQYVVYYYSDFTNVAVCRSAPSCQRVYPDCWCWWFGMSCCSLPSCSGRWLWILNTLWAADGIQNFSVVVPGRLGIVDYDEVELGNLHRQVGTWECIVWVNTGACKGSCTYTWSLLVVSSCFHAKWWDHSVSSWDKRVGWPRRTSRE